MSEAEVAVDRGTVRAATWQLVRRDPAAYALAWVQWVAFYLTIVPAGLLLRAVVDRLDPGAPGAASVWWLLGALAGAEVGRWLLLVAAAVQWHGAWVGWHTVPRLHALRHLVVDPGPSAGRIPSSPGEAVSRFRDDARDVAMVLDVSLDVSAAFLSAGVAVVVMATIDVRTTVAVVAPVVVVMLATRAVGPRLRTWRRASRRATAEVTGFIGDTFGSVAAVKAAGAEGAALARFEQLGHRRARAAQVDEVGTQLVRTFGGITGNLSIGLLLLVIAPSIAAGDLGAGDIALFTTYAAGLASLPRWAAALAATVRQAEVSVGRLGELMPGRDPMRGFDPVATTLRHGPGPLVGSPVTAPAVRTGVDRLERLEVEGLRVRAGEQLVLDGFDLVLDRGTFTVVTGPVGSGKSTLLRAVLGLVLVEGGRIRWNGEVVADPSATLVPPRVAYVPQVPRLFSESLADTVLLGVDGSGLLDALSAACLDEDLATMPEGSATVVGARGVRLSGGQIQRVAAARALVRRPELLVVDDLSSALDVATEARLWDRVLDAGEARATVLAVSHRPSALAAADRVVELELPPRP